MHTLVAASLVADHLMRRHESVPVDGDWTRHGAAAMAWLQIDQDELAHWEAELMPTLDSV